MARKGSKSLPPVHKKTVTINNKLGLHARAAAKFVQVASGFASEITVALDHKKISGKSIMGVMMLAAGKGTDIEISCIGPDEDDAANELEQLVLNKFGERE